jgi:GNAT superfamily N-acetyltransferase
MVWSDQSQVVFRILPTQLQIITAQLDKGRWIYRTSSASALARRARADLPEPLARELEDDRGQRRVHLIELDGNIVSWGFSAAPCEHWPLSETRSTLRVEGAAACLMAFETLPEYRGRRFYSTILSRILEERFRDGADAAYIWCSPANTASYVAIKRVGFQEVAIHRLVRVLGFERRSERRLDV